MSKRPNKHLAFTLPPNKRSSHSPSPAPVRQLRPRAAESTATVEAASQRERQRPQRQQRKAATTTRSLPSKVGNIARHPTLSSSSAHPIDTNPHGLIESDLLPQSEGNNTSVEIMDNRRSYNNCSINEFSNVSFNGSQMFNNGSRHMQNRYLSIPSANGAAFNSRLWEHESLCLRDTRVDLLEQIKMWSKDSHGPYIFWLNGIAGTGKSTIARTVANTWYKENQLGASFFFSKGRGDLGHAGKLFTSIASQLANALPALKPFICKCIEENPDIFHRALGEQWKYLIFRPLSSLTEELPEARVLILVIDALDECENYNDTSVILRLLAEAKSLNGVRLKVFITSRPEMTIRLGFRDMPRTAHHDFVLHDISQSIIRQDISTLFRYELEYIRRKHDIADGWPGEDTIELLSHRAQGLFIYAATACRFIGDWLWHPVDRLPLILKDDYIGQSHILALDAMYIGIMMHSMNFGYQNSHDEVRLRSEFRRIVGSIVILFDILPVTMLARLIDIPESTVRGRLRPLYSVLDVPETGKDQSPVRLLHPSFRDFLLDKERCTHHRIWIDEEKAHGDLFMRCLNIMSKHLHRDMCNLRLPGAPISEVENEVIVKYLPLDIQYACRYWVSHLKRSKMKLCDNDQVHSFLQENFLYWLEALSLIGKISDGVLMVRSLESILNPKSEANHDLRMMVYDAKRFVLNNISIIEIAPLQIYCSAILFSPKRSIIKSIFWDQIPCWIKNVPEVQENWSPSLQTLEGDFRAVNAVSFSPDGQLIAIASDKKTVFLRDSMTGMSQNTLEGHSSYVNAVAFLPDGRFLASASDDKTIRLWDPSTGASHCTLEGHSSFVWAVAFSPDGRLLASGSHDCSVRLWDPSTGASHRALVGHSSGVRAVAFSQVGELLASASDDTTIRLWDPSTGTSRCTLNGHSSSVSAVAFSPVGQLLASGSNDWTVRLWDSLTGASLYTIEGIGSCSTVAFSPDGQFLATTLVESQVTLCAPLTGASLCTLEGHSGAVSALAFSSDSQHVVSASHDGTVRIWDPSIGGSRCTFKGHYSDVWAVAFSPDGQLLASASDDTTIRLWDPSTGASHRALEGHTSSVNNVAFSPDGQLLASASDDKTIRLWDPSTGASHRALDGHASSVDNVAFSPDGELLASASADTTIRLWDPSTGASHRALEGHTSSVNNVAFSPDGQLLASASDDKTIRLWDPSTGASHRALEGHTSAVNDVAFSPDGQLLASASADTTIRLWDPSTGSSRCTLKGHYSDVWVVAFSPDGQLLASGSLDCTVRLWDIDTENTILLLNTVRSVRQLAFSSNGPYLETNQGILELNTLTHFQSRSQFTSASCALYAAQQWVAWGNQNILWLPADYRPQCVSVRHNVIVIGHSSGGVTFIELDLDTLPLASVP
ncbi:WD40-repeat-containing domain protein [Trichophaea hybrida]|nr:WD40-repeat-containing domain protein [Trichophaea hybrida]